MHADGGDFFFADAAAGHGPNAGELADALGKHAEVAAGADECFFEQANVVYRAEVRAFFAGEIATQIDDGVSDELTWTVVGDIAPAVDLVQLDASLGKQVVADEDVGARRISSEGKNWWVLQEEKRVVDQVLLSSCDDLLLDGEGLRIGD